MKKKICVLAFVLFVLFAVSTVIAEEYLQCKDPADGTITVRFLGSVVQTSYSGKSAQTFQVVVLLKDNTTQYLTFSYPKAAREQTRPLTQEARGPIDKIYKCDLTTSY